jgi:hypothetical protein
VDKTALASLRVKGGVTEQLKNDLVQFSGLRFSLVLACQAPLGERGGVFRVCQLGGQSRRVAGTINDPKKRVALTFMILFSTKCDFAAQVCTRWPELGNKEIRKDIEKNARHKHSSPARGGGGTKTS